MVRRILLSIFAPLSVDSTARASLIWIWLSHTIVPTLSSALPAWQGPLSGTLFRPLSGRLAPSQFLRLDSSIICIHRGSVHNLSSSLHLFSYVSLLRYLTSIRFLSPSCRLLSLLLSLFSLLYVIIMFCHYYDHYFLFLLYSLVKCF